MEGVAIAIGAFTLGVLAGATLAGLWLGSVIDALRRGLAVDIADEIENRRGYVKAHPEVGK